MYYERTTSDAIVQLEDTQAVGSVLIVDDDAAFGRFAVTSLESRGHDVDWTGSIADALATLYLRRYDLVIVDLCLPDGNGLELLRQGTDSGLLLNSAAVILTAHEFEEPSDIRVLRKPVDADLDPFLDRIGTIVAMARRRQSSLRSRPPSTGSAKDRSSRKRPRIELVLYTSAASEKCQRAIRTVQQVLEEYDTEQVRFVVKDLAGDPEAGDEDAVVFTPTLVKRGPGSRTYIVGNLDEPHLVTDLLDVNGITRLRRRP